VNNQSDKKRNERFKKYIADLEELYECAYQWYLDHQPNGDCEIKTIENQEVEK
jgi:hypothetical protein